MAHPRVEQQGAVLELVPNGEYPDLRQDAPIDRSDHVEVLRFWVDRPDVSEAVAAECGVMVLAAGVLCLELEWEVLRVTDPSG